MEIQNCEAIKDGYIVAGESLVTQGHWAWATSALKTELRPPKQLPPSHNPQSTGSTNQQQFDSQALFSPLFTASLLVVTNAPLSLYEHQNVVSAHKVYASAPKTQNQFPARKGQ